MDKGIRPFCNNKFVELNNLRTRGELTNTQFRKNVMAACMEEFGITLASAATHYNHAFKTVKGLNSELVSGLGRPEDKKGGRKPKAKVVAEAVKAILGDAAPVDSALLLTALEMGKVQNHSEGTSEVVPQEPNDAALPEVPEVKTYTVTRVKDGAVVAEGLLLADAEALIAKAIAAKKAKLMFA